jgi:sulfonate transport system permease protein
VSNETTLVHPAAPLATPSAPRTGASEAARGRPWSSRASRVLFAILLPLLVIGLWQGSSDLGLIRPILLPPPSRVAQAFWDLALSGDLERHMAVSLLRVLEGFALAAVTGLMLGLGIGLSPALDRATDLFIQLLKPIPPIAWIPLAILWFGIGEGAKIWIIFLGAVFPILVNTIDGIRQTDHRYVELARILEVPRRRFVFQVVVPGALPAIMTGLRVGLMVAWMCVVAAELIAASSGVGYLIMDARQLSQTDVVLVGMITIGAMGKLLDWGLKSIEARLITWKKTYRGQ